MLNTRTLAEDLVYHITGKLFSEVDPVWPFEDDYIETVLEVEDMLNDQLGEARQD